MRFITIPETVPPQNIITEERLKDAAGKEITFYRWLRVYVLNDKQRWGLELEHLFRAEKVAEDVRDAKVGAVVEIEDGDYDKVLECVKIPTVPYEPLQALAFMPYIRAITEAAKKDPRKVSPKAKASPKKKAKKAA